MTKLKKGGLLLLLAIAILIAVLLTRTASFTPSEQYQQFSARNVQVDANQVANHLSEAIRFKTVSHDDWRQREDDQYEGFLAWIAATYPEVQSQLTLERVNDFTLLYRWKGKQSNEPAVLMSAHYDVVPVNPGTESLWEHAPYAGEIADGYIWGRGSLDDKSAVIALLEATTLLIKQGYEPQGDVYLAFTHDEEIGSVYGSQAVTELFKGRDIKLAWTLDEGSFVLDGMVPGVSRKIASVNIAEKGYLTLEFVAHGQGGHSSMPPQDTAVSILAEAIVKLKNAPVPGGLEGLSEQLYTEMAKYMPYSKRLLFANSWLFKPLIEKEMGKIPSGNAMLRTTTAPTMLEGSVKANVLPITAKAKVNFRIHPRDNVESVIAYVKGVINDDRIDINVVREFEASNVSDKNANGFNKIAAAAREVHGDDVIVTPGLTIAATDSRYYSEITNSYRFNPMSITSQDLAGFHGTNERISIDNMVKAVEFYARLMSSEQPK